MRLPSTGGFYPDFTDTSKKADNGPRRCVISKRRKYSAEFKREAVALANDPEVTQCQIAQAKSLEEIKTPV